MDKVFIIFYKVILCKGVSVVVFFIVVIEICVNVVLLYDKYKELRRRRELRIVDDELNSRMMKEVLYEVCYLWFVISILLVDLILLFDSIRFSKGVFEIFVVYLLDGIGYVVYIGGFLFGMVYYLVMLYVLGYRREYIR